MTVQFPEKGPLKLPRQVRDDITALTYRHPVEITWGECDDGDEWAALTHTGPRGDHGAVAMIFPVREGWRVVLGVEDDQWTFKTAPQSIERLAALL